jgi:hypothetical protein
MARVGSVRNQGEPVAVVILTVIPAELEAARRVLRIDIDDGSREKDHDGDHQFLSGCGALSDPHASDGRRSLP